MLVWAGVTLMTSRIVSGPECEEEHGDTLDATSPGSICHHL